MRVVKHHISMTEQANGQHAQCAASEPKGTSRPRFRSNRVPEPGVFLLMDVAKSAARAAGVEVVDLSIGASDMPPPPEALEALKVGWRCGQPARLGARSSPACSSSEITAYNVTWHNINLVCAVGACFPVP